MSNSILCSTDFIKHIPTGTLQEVEDQFSSSRLLAKRYELLGIIGSGGSATVWRAIDRRLDRPVAIKILLPRFASDTTFQKRMEREARHIASLHSENVVSIFDVDSSNGSPFIVMELVEGMSLRDLLTDAGPLQVERVLTVANGVLAALARAHDSGLIHRDIKPANVLLARDGPVKVTDFGISRSLSQTTDITATGLFTGTIVYSSPEQLSGGAVGATSDLYSLGCVLYECLCGAPPFGADEPSHAAFQQRFADPVPIGDRRPEISGSLAAAVMRALEKDPERRFDTAAEMRSALEDSTDGVNGGPAQATVRSIYARQNERKLSGPRTGRQRAGGWRKLALAASLITVAAALGVVVVSLVRGTPGSGPSTLGPGGVLRHGGYLLSTNGRYRVDMQAGGSLVTVVARTGEPIWSTGSDGNPGAYAVLQQDGNFAVYPMGTSVAASGHPSSALYQTQTAGHSGSTLHLLNNGNLVLSAASDGKWLWQSGSVPGLVGSRLTAGEGLHPLEYLRSRNGAFELSDDGSTGQLRLYAVTSASCSIWTAPTSGLKASVAVLRPDGDLVMYGPVSRVTWSSSTAGNPGAQLVLGDDGSLSLLSASGKLLWRPPTGPPEGNSSGCPG